MTDNWLLKQKARINPIHSYERTWQRILSTLATEGSCVTRQQMMYFTGWQPTSKHSIDDKPKLCTPLDRAALEREAKKRLIEEIHSRPKLTLKQRFLFVKPAVDSLESSHTHTTESPEITRSKELRSPTKSAVRPLSSFYKNKKRQSLAHSLRDPPPSTREITKSISQRTYLKPFVPPANMTAYAYIVYELPDIVHVCWNSQNAVEMASLTKIMTCMVALRVASWTSERLEQSVLVGSLETNITGTTAGLQKNYRYSIYDLLYGLMLPSGNDASLALAVWAGRLIHLKNSGANRALRPELSLSQIKKREAICLFVEEMNRVASEIGMKKTRYANPHGLSNCDNKSTALDLAVLCRFAMQNQLFRKIVSTRQYQCTALNAEGQIKSFSWENTHRLIKKPEYLGIKTGMTTTAGACLASSLRLATRDFIIVVLGCKHTDRRFRETETLKKWVMRKEGLSKPTQQEEEQEEQIVIVDGSCEFD